MKNELWVYKSIKNPSKMQITMVQKMLGFLHGADKFVGLIVCKRHDGFIALSTNNVMLVSGLIHKVAPSILGGWVDE